MLDIEVMEAEDLEGYARVVCVSDIEKALLDIQTSVIFALSKINKIQGVEPVKECEHMLLALIESLQSTMNDLK